MEIRTGVTLPFPRDRVFFAYRDRLAEVADYLPNIRRIRVVSRTDRGDEVELVNEWTGGGDIPEIAHAIIHDSMLRWTDYATWKTSSFTAAWRIEAGALPGVIESAGEDRFVETDEGTLVEIHGDLRCDCTRVRGVPRLLAKTVGAAVEKIVVRQVSINLVAISKGVGKLLAKEAR
jgi:hypothetical protein